MSGHSKLHILYMRQNIFISSSTQQLMIDKCRYDFAHTKEKKKTYENHLRDKYCSSSE